MMRGISLGDLPPSARLSFNKIVTVMYLDFDEEAREIVTNQVTLPLLNLRREVKFGIFEYWRILETISEAPKMKTV